MKWHDIYIAFIFKKNKHKLNFAVEYKNELHKTWIAMKPCTYYFYNSFDTVILHTT
jgi:hypothetical protein